MKTKTLKLKDETVEAIVFESNDPPDFVNVVRRNIDDLSGIYAYTEYMVGDRKITNGDLLIRYQNGSYISTVILPWGSVGTLFEEVK